MSRGQREVPRTSGSSGCSGWTDKGMSAAPRDILKINDHIVEQMGKTKEEKILLINADHLSVRPRACMCCSAGEPYCSISALLLLSGTCCCCHFQLFALSVVITCAGPRPAIISPQSRVTIQKLQLYVFACYSWNLHTETSARRQLF